MSHPTAGPRSQKRVTQEEEDVASLPRKRPRSDATDHTSQDSGTVTVKYHWLDCGSVDRAVGRTYHRGIRLHVEGKSFEVHRGDVVRLYAEEHEPGNGWLCKIVKLWDDGHIVSFQGLWFLTKEEIDQYDGPWEGVLTKPALLRKMRSNELVLSDRGDDNDIGSILSVVTPIYQVPAQRTDMGPNQFLCRYRLETAGDRWVLQDYGGEDAEDPAEDQATDEPTMTNDTIDDESSTTSSAESSTLSDQVRIDGEGSNLRGDIQIGTKYQVQVPPFVPGATFVSKRKPQLVWKAAAVPEEVLHDFLKRLTPIVNSYLEKHGLTTVHGPVYTPLSLTKGEEWMRTLNLQKLYPSHMSSASSLTNQPNGLLKECDVDAVLEMLHAHSYNVDKALDAIQNDVSRVARGWTKTEKILFNEGFRQEQGAIRNIAKLFQPMKTHEDVIDYWYRFKMADQFRLYQEKKRDQAIRMMECIEKRRYHECTVNAHRPAASSVDQPKDSHWSETSAIGLATATEDRRRTAKALLLDVNKIVGSQVTAEIAAVLRKLHENYDAKLKRHLFTLLTGHPELQQRFLEFLPKN